MTIKRSHVATHSQHSKFNMFHLQILVLLTGPTGWLQETHNNHQLDRKSPSVGIARENRTKGTVQQSPSNTCPTKYKSTREKQHNLIKTFCKKFQDRRQINKICTPASDSSKEFNNFITEFAKNIILEDLDNSSAWLAPPNASVINEVFIEGFHTI